MHATYKGTLRGNRIEWQDDIPKQLESEAALPVLVTILRDSQVEENGPQMAQALERLATRGGVSSIADAGRWQREQREDRDVSERT